MRPWLVLPVKSLGGGKSRLGSHLCEMQRRELNLELLERSLATAAAFPGLDRTLLVSRCPDILALARAQGARVLLESGRGLNEAVSQAVATLKEFNTHILVMSCDLPLAEEDDLRALVGSQDVVIATDRAALGTNALCLPPGVEFQFHYGDSSCSRHAEEARRRGLKPRVLQRSKLAFDLDTYADLREWHRLARSFEPVAPPLNGAYAPLG